ncbi:transposase [Thermoanaerobacter ethanolicus]|uniref:transposase n=1 Tax=Thermoanaerobacter ethanolicus TaxID=1757 RepID=UPI001013CF0A
MYQLQLLLNIPELFTSLSKIDFYSSMFKNLDLSSIPEFPSSSPGRKGYSHHAMFRAFIVMKAERFGTISDLLDYLRNNLIIAHLCGFNILKPLPSYWTFRRFINEFSHDYLTSIFQNQVNILKNMGIISGEFISMDSTPIKANTKLNNPKSFSKNKFSKDNQPKSDKDCKLGVYSASNDSSNKRYKFYWGYKNHIIVDAISGLPIAETTTPADVPDFEVALSLLEKTNKWFNLKYVNFIADKGYDVKRVYNFVRDTLHGHCFIPLNKRNSKSPPLTDDGYMVCEAGIKMLKDGKQYFDGFIKQKFVCKFCNSKDDSACPIKHPKYFNGKKHRGCTKYAIISSDYRSSINRDSLYFKAVYRLRVESERYNSRFKALDFEKAYVRNINSVSNLNTFGHITLLTVAIVAIKLGKFDEFKSLSALMQSA